PRGPPFLLYRSAALSAVLWRQPFRGAYPVRLRKPGRRHGRLVAPHARSPGRHVEARRDVPGGRLRLRLDRRFARRIAAPWRLDKAGTALHDGRELVVARRGGRVALAELARPLEQRRLNLVQKGRDGRGERLHRQRLLGPGI